MNANDALWFKNLIESIIKKYVLVLGPQITFARAGMVNGITVDLQGNIIEFKTDPNKLLTDLITNLVDLSPNVANKILLPLLPADSGFTNITVALLEKVGNDTDKLEFIGDQTDLQSLITEHKSIQSEISEKTSSAQTKTETQTKAETVEQDTSIANLDTTKIDEVNRMLESSGH